ncbi:MAG: S1C family serine protease [Roseomonas sp.]
MRHLLSQSVSSLSGSTRLARRDIARRLAFGAGVVAVTHLTVGQTMAAGESTVRGGEAYARLKAASLMILVDGQQRGSGTLIDATGFAITAAHVIIRKGRRIEVISATAERLGAEVVAVDLGHDLALLRLPVREGGYPFLPLAEELPGPGADAFYIGTPVPMQKPVWLRAMVSGEGIAFTHFRDIGYIPVMTLAASMPRGSSGGSFVDTKGALLGVLVGGTMQNEAPAGFLFASPSEAIRKLLTNRQNAATPLLGMIVSELSRQHPNYHRLFPAEIEGLFVTTVTQNAPAARAGIKEWDLVIEAEGQKLATVNEFLALVRRKKPNEGLTIGILEPGASSKRNVTITLGLLEASWR